MDGSDAKVDFDDNDPASGGFSLRQNAQRHPDGLQIHRHTFNFIMAEIGSLFVVLLPLPLLSRSYGDTYLNNQIVHATGETMVLHEAGEKTTERG